MNILITGASRGIGAAAYALLKKHGHNVVGHSTKGSDTENVAKDIDQVEQGFGRFSEQIANFKATAKAFVNGIAA